MQIAARHFVLMEAHYIAVIEWEAARGTPRAFDAFCKALQAQRDLDAYELKLLQLAHLRAAVKELKAGPETVSAADPATP